MDIFNDMMDYDDIFENQETLDEIKDLADEIKKYDVYDAIAVRRHIVGGANRRLISAIIPPRLHSPAGDCTLSPVQPQSVVGLFEEQKCCF